MMPDNATRWTVTIPCQADIARRSCLAPYDLNKGGLSTFMEDTGMWRVFDQTMTESHRSAADRSAKDLRATVDQATDRIRKEVRGPRRQDCRP